MHQHVIKSCTLDCFSFKDVTMLYHSSFEIFSDCKSYSCGISLKSLAACRSSVASKALRTFSSGVAPSFFPHLSTVLSGVLDFPNLHQVVYSLPDYLWLHSPLQHDAQIFLYLVL